jgi:DNA-binding transcriptional MerR regulator
MASQRPIRKSLKSAAPSAPPVIPDKLYFRIGDVARLLALPAYVLRFWETEFPQLRPNKAGTGQRLYRRKDVEIALRIKTLLYEQGYTIPGARQVLRAELEAARGVDKSSVILSGASQFHREAQSKDPEGVNPTSSDSTFSTSDPAALQALRDELRRLSAQLNQPIADAPEPTDKVKPIRPRAASKSEPVDPNLNQRDLFPSE